MDYRQFYLWRVGSYIGNVSHYASDPPIRNLTPAPDGERSHPMTEHTPGPWTVARQAAKQSEGEMFQKPLFIKDDSDKPVCIMGSGNVHYANAEANARLIAAAPALLAALETLARESGELAAEFMKAYWMASVFD
jgi:hypothetical protein